MNTYIYYVYAYLRKSNGTPYYIGKGKNDRAFKKHGRIKTPKDKSKIKIMETNLSEIGAFALERRYIRWYGRKDLGTGILHNQTDGGEGNAGLVFSEEHKRNISESIKGKKHSPETIEKIKQKAKNRTYRKGFTLSEEHKMKIGDANRGKKREPFSEEWKDKIRETMKKVAKTRLREDKTCRFVTSKNFQK